MNADKKGGGDLLEATVFKILLGIVAKMVTMSWSSFAQTCRIVRKE